MSSPAKPLGIDNGWVGQFVGFLTRELAPYPGRALLVSRIAVASVLTMIVLTAFKVPNAALSAFYVLAISHRTLRSTVSDGLNILLANAIGIAVLVIGAMLFVDFPLTHFLFAAFCFFAVFFVTRTFVSYSAAFGFSVVIAAAFPAWDLPYPPGVHMAEMLWMGWGVSLASMITIFTEWMFGLFRSSRDRVQAPLPERRAAPFWSKDWLSPRTLFVEDAFSNPEYVTFALRGCLASTICYLIYTAVAWPGISVCLSTCIITAPLFNTRSPMFFAGTPTQRLSFRLAGSFTGGVIFGMGSQVLLWPYLDFTGFVVVFMAVSLFAGWFATASPLLSYYGRQAALGFYLTTLQSFSVGASLAVSRDRVVGIWMALLIMWSVFDNIWPALAPRESTVERVT